VAGGQLKAQTEARQTATQSTGGRIATKTRCRRAMTQGGSETSQRIRNDAEAAFKGKVT
jgi:hypothetical protein